MRKRALLLPLVSLAGCNLAPDYQQPVTTLAPAYPTYEGAAPGPGTGPARAGELGWRDFFLDPRLQALIASGLTRNRDLAQAYARIDQARARYRIQDAQRLPQLEIGGTALQNRDPPLQFDPGQTRDPPAEGVEYTELSIYGGVSAFELDLWGRVRNLAKAERERYLATLEGAEAFRLSLVAQIAATYFDIRAGEERIKLAERSLAARREGVRIARLRLDSGVTSTIDHDQAMLLLTQAETEIADIRRATEQSRNLMEVLVGGPLEAPLPEGNDILHQLRAIEPGLPSDLLENRPDIRAAEHALRAANANIGVAKAAFFPRISLTAAFGFASGQLDDLFDGDNRAWSVGAGGFILPIFDWGRRRAGVDLSEAQAEELIAAYQRSVQGAFRDVADALVARQRLAEQIAAQTRTVAAQSRLARTANLRYANGISIYLEVLDAERNEFSASQQLLRLEAAELQNAVSLYAALGGGDLRLENPS
ncbi:efflux transporter outer membrane subunit [Novosphingobium profundi]|uniref:efflux transporter outer membrane subunit n=1 Tax=Novosphingobium profundi TaxID=1774954 RepID=UPI001BDA12F6|nr:efflux transporter outer membrane subunit [Novosphingobium profundi]MBT0671433.1 efflux transporter outer membrane subunit [Novosphingobium profundi]